MRWLHAVVVSIALIASAAPAVVPVERAVAADVREVGGDREERALESSVSLRPAIVAIRSVEAKPRTSDRFVLVPDRWLRHCALIS